ncbi:uncharacterized protein LOC124532571 [Vanessa cardui]|uniref:uncharacterized protein LOC124532571 n=1 Tax=Vanessa cardui TaxID=171605 RepID=UPI001F1404A3|nr:uncharacterized protein LOC124532571 [Vanessa cardui]
MRNSLLITLVLLAGCQHSFQSKLQNNVIAFKDSLEILDIDIQHSRIQRDLSDIWSRIKSKIVRAWEAFKDITNNTKQNIKEYVLKIKNKIQVIAKVFEKKFENLKEELKNIIEQAITTGENVKKCVKENKNAIETLLKEIFINVTTCISNNMQLMANIEISHNSNIDDSIFLNSVQNKIKTSLEACEENSDQCLNNVKEEILADIDVATWNVSQKAFEVRTAVDNGLDIVVTCVTEGLTDASAAIANETIQIIQCVKNKE